MLLILPLFVLLPCSIIATTMEDLPPDNFVSGINELRRKYAKQYNVPNMHELMWSEDLLNILKPLDWSASWLYSEITWRDTDFQSYEAELSQIEMDAIDFSKKTPEEVTKAIEDGSTGTMKRMELINPLQRFIACSPKSKKGAVLFVCIVGTEGSFTLFDTTGQSTSIPGSQCHRRYTGCGRITRTSYKCYI
ncbi:hypothetical protein GCK72_007581 [Caenorhabditis remanei]|uniref:Uncharacterized protein n=1 Tax=Caenorhabditis remanei TaxID=31234 RepID=A0A6A5HP96_CAERE|nr:hypothetical protein GCK72_007581 [Caenorhabditis remanei]KAF1767622.1 hypothetical protein GCK72_007581 [Caenorhabditis remanei]